MKSSEAGEAIELADQIQEMLTILYKNPDLEKFIIRLHRRISAVEIDRYIPRIKSIESAQMTAKVKEFKSLEDANDYVGVAIIVKNENSIYEIATKLQAMYPNCGSIDFLSEENVYSPLCYVKKVPPLSYNILTREKIGEQSNVPVEIRICTRESYLSNQAIHDTIYKNYELDIPLEERIKLLCISQHVVYKLALLYMGEELSAETRKIHKQELNRILKDHKSMIMKYEEVFLNVIMDYGMNLYEYEHLKGIDGEN